MAPDAATIDSIVTQITSTNNLQALNHFLRNGLPKEAREVVLSKMQTNGQDPLTVLDFANHSLGVLYIMSARTLSNHPPTWATINQFCRSFSPDHLRHAPDRVTFFASAIQRLANHMGNPKLSVEPLYALVTRYPYSPHVLTPIHQIFLLQCITARVFSVALPVLLYEITMIDMNLCPDLTYNDNLLHHYLGGIILAALKKWGPAEEHFEICVTSPGSVPAAIQLEALKKLKLVQLISKGQTSALPKYTHPSLSRLFKSTPYQQFVNAYPNKIEQLYSIIDKESQTFATEQNMGLIQQAISRASRWSVKKLTRTYVTLGLKEIGKAVKIEDEEEVRALLLSMIESSDISAQISADGTVTFSDPPAEFSKEEVDKILKDAQDEAMRLEQLEMSMARSRDFISKVVKTRDDWGGSHMSMDEDMMMAGGYPYDMANMGGDYA